MAGSFNFVQCKPDPNCKGCFYYRGSVSIGVKMCMYWDIEDKLRGCPPGAGCDKYTKRKPTVKELRHASLYARRASWDKERGYQLYCQGWTGAEIARHFEVENITIERAFTVWKQRAAAEGIDHRLAYERRRKARLKNDG